MEKENKKSKKELVLLLHGSDRTLKPEDFDFNYSSKDNDFGKGIYFTYTYKGAFFWSRRHKQRVINWYIFRQGEARRDNKIHFNDNESMIKWINTIIGFLEGSYPDDDDFIIGPTIDGMASTVINMYRQLAIDKGIPMSMLDDNVKLEMAEALKPDIFDWQIAVKSKKGLYYLEFIDSMEVPDLQETITYVDPAEAAAKVTLLIMSKYGVPEDQAMVDFIGSETFHAVIGDQKLAQLPPEKILELYEKEVGF